MLIARSPLIYHTPLLSLLHLVVDGRGNRVLIAVKMLITRSSFAYHTLLLSLLHLVVDGLCACGIVMMSYRLVDDVEVCTLIILYDLLAFATQPLTGRWLDATTTGSYGLKLAGIFLLGGTLISLLPISRHVQIAMTGGGLLGLGNSLFHVYGGKYVAVTSHHDIRVMGVFVSTGAVGLAIGLGFSNSPLLLGFLFAFLLLSALHLRRATTIHEAPIAETISVKTNQKGSIAETISVKTNQKGSIAETISVKTNQKGSIAENPIQPLSFTTVCYLLCLMLVVSGRAFIGEVVPSLRNSLPALGVPLTMVVVSVVVMLGKMSGGFLAKKWGCEIYFAAVCSSVRRFFCYARGTIFSYC